MRRTIETKTAYGKRGFAPFCSFLAGKRLKLQGSLALFRLTGTSDTVLHRSDDK
jgi:hypothetical protein